MSPISKRLAGAGLAAAIALVAVWEGRELTAYPDIVGVWTICDGDTHGVRPGQTATPQECDRRIYQRLQQYDAQLSRCIDNPLPEPAHVALLSLAYNVGVPSVCSSTALRRMNAGDIEGGCEAIPRFVCVTVEEGQGDTTGQCVSALVNKRFVQGLDNRRQDEKRICMTAVRAEA